MLTALGTIGDLDLAAIPAEALGRARHIHSGSFFLQGSARERLPAFLAAARSRGITTSFDTNWDPAERWDGVAAMLRAADLFFPNAAEARRIAGSDDVEAAARELARLGAEGRDDGGPLVVVKLGGDGALACRADGGLVRTRAMPVEPVDTTGAGDSFNAGFLRAWLDGRSTHEALRYAAACGALSTRGLGGIEAQPTRAEVASALAAWTAG
jgi:sugar/nucleoside kinase (ribokinase family)